jgi:hypothetical protein
MTKISMPLFTDELDKIVELMEKFPGAVMVTITRDTGSGIGYTVEAAIPYEHDGVKGEFKTEITGVDNW